MKINISLDENEVDEAKDILYQIQALSDSIDELRYLIDEIRGLIDEQKEMP